MEQRSDEWVRARCGKVTASRLADVMASGRSGEAASRKNYRAELIAERLTGQPYDSGFTSAAMSRGIELESEAVAAYELRTGHTVEPVGFVDHPTIELAGASPDGLCGFDGLVEIKCPNTATHLDYWDTHCVPRKYALQIQWQLACTLRDWCDFVSYDPRLPPKFQLLVIPVERDTEQIEQLEKAVIEFLASVDEAIKRLTEQDNG